MYRKSHGGRARPRNKKKVRYVDGFAIRNIFPDFDVVESHWSSGDVRGDLPTPFIPKDEVWVDRRFRKEARFLLEVHRIERLKRDWPYAKVRSYLKERLVDDRPPPPFVVRSERRGAVTLKYVRGEIVRKHFDPCFIFGGHDLVYPKYIPRGEVWIDIRQDPREVPYTIFHELHERKLMQGGMPYHLAHKATTVVERGRRKREISRKKARPLKLRPHLQKGGFCGPASLKICLAYFGREYDEAYLGELCGTTPAFGTDHEALVLGAQALGAKVLAKRNGSFAELRRFVRRERLPVIVGWYSPTNRRKWKFDPDRDEVEDHFSVVYHVSATHVYLMDPDEDSGRRRMAIAKFMKLWWDTDGPDGLRVDRWFMVLNFEGKRFAR